MEEAFLESAIEVKLRPIKSQLEAIGNALAYYSALTQNHEAMYVLGTSADKILEVIATIWGVPYLGEEEVSEQND